MVVVFQLLISGNVYDINSTCFVWPKGCFFSDKCFGEVDFHNKYWVRGWERGTSGGETLRLIVGSSSPPKNKLVYLYVCVSFLCSFTHMWRWRGPLASFAWFVLVKRFRICSLVFWANVTVWLISLWSKTFHPKTWQNFLSISQVSYKLHSCCTLCCLSHSPGRGWGRGQQDSGSQGMGLPPVGIAAPNPAATSSRTQNLVVSLYTSEH